ncbi:sensor histidine kinase FleS [Niveibacterium umoris]|uniref:histidine kinase n=1 Tax=Niveibacterium umoris TaxID=1193620 RepID=A0A840BG36_9RHOO|nr:PAS domain-containing sensor histidine kinase [Niveibacterium umoris]MBB4011154.1 two-component system sensor histidine kinase FlrB [Niveibacterium umoris]
MQETIQPPLDAAQLAEAFRQFSEASAQLTQAYSGLERQVERLNERLTGLLAALPAGVVLLDASGKVEQVNAAGRAMLQADLVGTDWSAACAQLLRPSDTTAEFETGPEDAARRLALSQTAEDSAGGRIVLLHDVTEAWLMRRNAARNERLAAMGEMVAGLAHQLRTPLAAALLYAGNLAEPTLSPADRVRCTERTLERLRHLERLIRDMLSFARGEALGSEDFDVCELVAELEHTIEPVAARRAVAFSSECRCAGLRLAGHRKDIAGALTNLLENALQAVGEGGSVRLLADSDAERVRFSVEDNGRGIDAALQARLFEPFFTTRADGTGLGLAIARGVARAHGGEISLRSTPGEGSTFVLDLPLPAREELA